MRVIHTSGVSFWIDEQRDGRVVLTVHAPGRTVASDTRVRVDLTAAEVGELHNALREGASR
jgi:hypothetical protein